MNQKQLDRDYGEIVREAHAALDDATRLNPDLVKLITEKIPLREEGRVISVGHDDPMGAGTVHAYRADNCPFCGQERTFRVIEGASHWACSACLQAGSRVGGAVEWVMLMDDVSAADAVRRLRARGSFSAD